MAMRNISLRSRLAVQIKFKIERKKMDFNRTQKFIEIPYNWFTTNYPEYCKVLDIKSKTFNFMKGIMKLIKQIIF